MIVHDYVVFRGTELLDVSVDVLGGEVNTIVFPNVLSIRAV